MWINASNELPLRPAGLYTAATWQHAIRGFDGPIPRRIRHLRLSTAVDVLDVPAAR